jgi:hypothetical protein
MNAQQLYQTDFYAWTLHNAQLLQENRFSELDLLNLIEEVRDMGASQQRALESRLLELLMHLLKWQFQPERQGNSWLHSITKQRVGIKRLLKNNPSLTYQLKERVDELYSDAREYASYETRLAPDTFSSDCPYTLEQILDGNFLPAALNTEEN